MKGLSYYPNIYAIIKLIAHLYEVILSIYYLSNQSLTMSSIENNLPVFTAQNLFKEDPLGALFFKKWMGEHYAPLQTTYLEFGENAAKASPLSMKADQNRPQLKKIDVDGNSIDVVYYDESYHELEKLSFGKGIISIKYDPVWLEKYNPVRHLLGFSMGYYFAQNRLSYPQQFQDCCCCHSR